MSWTWAAPGSLDLGILFPQITGEVSKHYQMRAGALGALELPSHSPLIRKGEMSLIYGSSTENDPILQLRGSAFLLGSLPYGFRLGPSLQFWMLKGLNERYALLKDGETDFGYGARIEWQKETARMRWGCSSDLNLALTLPKRTLIYSVSCFGGWLWSY